MPRLRPWQKKVIKGIYDQPTRRVIISFARKNAKTTLSAFLCLLHLVGPEAKKNSQLYSAAQSREQAGVLFNLAVKIIRQSPDLDNVIRVQESAKQLSCDEIGTLYRALSAEATTAYGLSPVFVVHDELGQVVGPRSTLYEALETGSGAHKNPLSVVISTQAPSDSDLLSILIDDALAGHDPETKVFLYTADEDIDPFSEKAIKQANPAYGDFLNKDEIRREANKAKRMPSFEAGFRNLNLNQRIAREAPFIAQTIWNKNSLEPRPEDFQGDVVIGLDLSDRNDLTALVAAARGHDGCISVRSQFFLPAEGIQEKSVQDRVPYDLWSQQGYLTLCPGRTVGYDFVAGYIRQWFDDYNVTQLLYDRWGWKHLMPYLRDVGFDEHWRERYAKDHGQGYKDMSPALKTVEIELINHRLRHGGHPILTWCAANSVTERDAAGNIKLNKKKATGRIDGMVAMTMAVGALTEYKEAAPAPSIMFV